MCASGIVRERNIFVYSEETDSICHCLEWEESQDNDFSVLLDRIHPFVTQANSVLAHYASRLGLCGFRTTFGTKGF